MIEITPFMLSLSKHVLGFFSDLLLLHGRNQSAPQLTKRRGDITIIGRWAIVMARY